MLYITRWFGVTGSDAERNPGAESAYSEEIVKTVLLMQATAARQHRALCRGTHAKGVSARAQFEVFDFTSGRDTALAARLTKGIFAKPGIYPATVRFGNSDPHINSDFKRDVRSLSISVDLTHNGTEVPDSGFERQDFSLQNATTLPLNDARAFLSTMKMITAANPLRGLWSLSLPDQLSVLRTLVLAQIQARQSVKHYQQLRYWSTVPFRHGPVDVVKQSATPSRDNPSHALLRSNPDALQDELVRHLEEDSVMSSFDIGLQFLDTERITYWGERQDASFWIENASVEWKETEAPFHSVARLTLTPKSRLSSQASEAIYFDVTGNATPDSAPVGSINRVRCSSEAASRKARTHANAASEAELLSQCQR